MPRHPSHYKADPPNPARHKYEAPGHQFLDWVHRMGWEKTWWGRTFLLFDEKLKIRFILGIFLFAVLLALVLNFEIETPMNFTVGEIAPMSINSPINLQMIDDGKTEEQRRDAESHILPVMDYDPSSFSKTGRGTSEAFERMRFRLRTLQSLQASKNWAEFEEFTKFKDEFDREIGAKLPEYLFDWLVRKKFNAHIESAVLKTLVFWLSHRVISEQDLDLFKQFDAVIVRNVERLGPGRETVVDRAKVNELRTIQSFVIEDVKSFSGLSVEDQDNLFSLVKLLVPHNVVFNEKETLQRQVQARRSVAPTFVSIKKNQVLVVEGETIQPFHIAVLNEITRIKSQRRIDLLSLVAGLLLVIFILLFRSHLGVFHNRKPQFISKDLYVMGLILIGEVLITKVFLFVVGGSFVGKFGSLMPKEFPLYLAPIAAGPMLVGLLIRSGEVGMMFTLLLSMVMGMMLDMNYPFGIFILGSGLAALRGVQRIKERNDLYWSGVRTGLVSALMLALILVLERIDSRFLWRDLLLLIPAGFFSGIFSAMMALTIIPLLESLFNYTTDLKLLELSNLNHPLLRDMLIKAPGTYHHSMLVGSMVESAAEEVGANPLLAKVMAYYHDIGKMAYPNYFIENQRPGHNPHDHISPYMSKTLLIAHMKDGVEMGRKYKLGQPIIDGVLQHHGTTLIAYFYNKALDQAQAGTTDVHEEDFRYPGPKPQFPESAMCMLADSIEAAARTLDEPTPSRLQTIVRTIIHKKFMDAQLDECNLNLRDLNKIETAFTRVLLGIYHQRIDYPKSANVATLSQDQRAARAQDIRVTGR